MPAGRSVRLDAVAVALVGLAICVAGQRPWLMTAVVAIAIAGRLALFARAGGRLGPELAFLLVCVAVGGGNDWNTVVRHDVYAYDVPALLPVDGAIPVWMLLYWGLILRFVSRLARWPALGATPDPSDLVGLPGARRARPGVRLGIQLVLVLGTRQAVYRWFDDPLLSWLPFAAAAVLWGTFLGLSQRDRRLALLALTVGTAGEAALITVGGLHRYALGLVGGVPLWIMIWWPLAVLVWADVGGRIEDALGAQPRRRLSSPAASTSSSQPSVGPEPAAEHPNAAAPPLRASQPVEPQRSSMSPSQSLSMPSQSSMAPRFIVGSESSQSPPAGDSPSPSRSSS